MTEQNQTSQENPPKSRKRRLVGRRGPTVLGTILDQVFSVTMSLVIVAGLLLVGAALYLQGKDIAAPEWVRAELAARLAAAAPDISVRFDEVSGGIGTDWRPRILVRNVDIRAASGEEIVRFSDVSLSFDVMTLLDRRLAPHTLRAEGIFIDMRRTTGGTFTIQAGTEIGSARREVANIAQFIREVDEVLLLPTLSELRDVDVQSVTLRYEDLRSERAWTIDGGRMSMTRDGRDMTLFADLAILSGTDDVATISATYAGVIGETAADFGFTLANLDAGDIALQSPAFSWLGGLQAPISGALRGGVDADGSLRPLNASLQIGSGVVQPTPQARPVPIESAQSYFTYTPEDQRLQFSQLEIDTQWGRGSLEGYAQGVIGASGQITEFVGQFQISDVLANPAAIYDAPVQIAAAELDFRLNLAPFSLELGRLEIADRGSVLTASGAASVGLQGWQVSIDAALDRMAVDRVKTLWPPHVKIKSRRWVTENLFAGQVTNASTAVRIAQGVRPRVYLAFEFDGAQARFMRHMPLIEEGRGHASLVNDRFVVMIDDGHVDAPEGGRVEIAGSSFIIPDTRARPDTPAVVRLTAGAPVTAGLSLLNQPPLEIMRKTPFPVDVASGRATVDATVSMPLKPKLPLEEVSFDVVGTLRDVESDLIVPNRRVDAGELTLRASEEAVSIEGLGVLDGIPLNAVWRQPIGPPGSVPPGQVNGNIDLTPDVLETFGVTLPPGSVSGRSTAQVTVVTRKGEPPRLSLASDLVGLRLSVPQIGWAKSERTPATLDVDVVLGDAPQVDRLALDAPGLSLVGLVQLTPERQLDRVRLDSLQVGGWLNAAVDLISRGAGRPLALSVRGGWLDLRRMDLPQRPPVARGSPIAVALNRVVLSDTVAVTDVRGDFDTSGGFSGNFRGRVNGQAPIDGEVLPSGGRSAIRVRAADAGAVVSSAGLVQQGTRGGRIELELLPVGRDGAFDGTLSVKDVRVTNAPAIAALINSISVVGLINELNGDGIYFSDVDADFRLTPTQIILREASAVGASLGLSMDGIIVPDTGALQLQGVISPIYALNAVGSILTRRGEGLFGFNYSITGTSSDPQVFVNPLTALAPGMFRNLFRRAEPEVPLEEGEVRAPEPKPQGRVVISGSDR